MRSLIVIAGIGFLSACSTLGGRTAINIEEAEQAAKNHLAENNEKFEPSVVRYLDYPVFASRKAIPVEEDLPAILLRDVAFADAEALSIQEIARSLQIKTGIPVRVQPDALVPMRFIGTAGVKTDAATKLQGVGGAGGLSEKDFDRTRVQYQGPIAGLLDLIAANFNLFWEYDGRAVVVGRYQTEIYHLNAVGGKIDSSISVGGSGAEESGGGDQSLKSDYKVSLWDSVAAALESMLSTGGSITTSPATSTIIVTDTPDVQRRIAEYIDNENTNLIRQVQIGVKVLSITRKEGSEYGVNLSGVFNNGDIGASFKTPGVNGLLSSLTGQVIKPTNDFNGSAGVIAALQSVGDIQVSRDTSVVTLSNQPAQVRLVSERSYLAEVSSVITSGSDAISNELRPDTVSTGVTLQVRPRTLPDDDQIVMQIGLDFSTLVGLETVSSGSITTNLNGSSGSNTGQQQQSSSIQVPNIDRRAFMNTVRLRSGEVLMLSGFEGGIDSRDKTGTGHADNFIAGGSRKASSERTRIVVLLEPRILGD